MLNAILHSKAGRVKSNGNEEKSVRWLDLYQSREDLLTSAFFSRFTYLSGLMQHRLLREWLGGEGDFSEFKGVEYWPTYELDLKKYEQRTVEPDLLLRFGGCDVLIEVKPPAGSDQTYTQWRKQIDGYFYSQRKPKPLYYLAIGRIRNVLDEFNAKALAEFNTKSAESNLPNELFRKACAVKWKQVAVLLHDMLVAGDFDAQDSRVIKDMLKALKLYGVLPYNLLWDDLKDYVSKSPLNISALSAWKV